MDRTHSHHDCRTSLQWGLWIACSLIAACPLAVWAGPRERTPTMPEIIDRVRAAEKLTSNIEMVLRRIRQSHFPSRQQAWRKDTSGRDDIEPRPCCFAGGPVVLGAGIKDAQR